MQLVTLEQEEAKEARYAQEISSIHSSTCCPMTSSIWARVQFSGQHLNVVLLCLIGLGLVSGKGFGVR